MKTTTGYIYRVTCDRVPGANEGYHGCDDAPSDGDWIADLDGEAGAFVLSDDGKIALIDGWSAERVDAGAFPVGSVFRDEAGYSVVVKVEPDGCTTLVSFY